MQHKSKDTIFLILDQYKFYNDNPLMLITSTVVAFEDIIWHNMRPDCTKESVNTLSDLEDSNATFEVCCAYL